MPIKQTEHPAQARASSPNRVPVEAHQSIAKLKTLHTQQQELRGQIRDAYDYVRLQELELLDKVHQTQRRGGPALPHPPELTQQAASLQNGQNKMAQLRSNLRDLSAAVAQEQASLVGQLGKLPPELGELIAQAAVPDRDVW